MLSKVKKGAQVVERITEKGGLSAIRSAGRKAHAEQASARAARDAEVAEQLAKLPPRSRKANEALGLYHPVGGGVKLTKPVSGMHSTTVPDPMFNPPEIDIITPERLVKEEAALFPLVGDRAAAGKYLTHIGETELETPVRLTGGMRYMDANFNPVTPEESAAWESGLGRVTALGRQAARAGEGGRPVYGVYTAGSATNTDFNIMGANALIQQVPYSEISSKAEKEFDKAMREGSKKFPPLPDWPGIKSPEVRDLILDKNNGIIRTKLFDIMGKENFQSMGFPDVAATRKAIIEPELLDVETNQAGFRLAKMDPTGRIIENPLIPSDYPVAMAGQVAGRLDVPVDYQDIWQSHFDARRLLGQPESGDYYSFSRAHPIQYADDEWLNRLMEKRYQLEQKLKEGQAEGGAIDNDLKAWHEKTMAEGGAVGSPEGIPPLAMDLESDYQAYAAGGEVRMSNGGASEFEGFFESGLPPESPAKEILVGRGVRRKEPRIGEIFETPSQAVQGALGAFGSAGKGALQATVGLPGDIISLGRGVGAAVSPQPGENRLGAFLRGMEGETGLPTTEDVKKFLDQYGKAPFEQFETLGEFTGIPILAAPKVSGAIGRAAEDVAPYLRDLPVGASIKPVGPGGEKISVNELIRRLEAGEEMTPEEMQKAQYSKAQKEKYAQANIARAQKEPAPKEEAVKVPANEMGFFSSVEKAAANLKREEGSGDAFLSDIMKFNPSAGELEATGIVDFLKGKKSVTRQEVQDYIDQHNVQIEEVVRGTILDDVDRQKLNDINRRISRGFQEMVTAEEEAWFDATKARLAEYKEPKYEREGLILPGGKNYREILLKLPISKSNNLIRLENKAYDLSRQVADLREQYRTLAEIDPNSEETFNVFQQLKQLTKEKEKADFDFREVRAEEASKNYESTHWLGEPNTLMHLRMQDMTIGGKKTLVIEEIQSDWHQEGRVKGYKDPKQFIDYYDPTYVAARKRAMELLNEFNRNNDNPARQEEIRPLLDEARRAEEEIVLRRNKAIEGVPNAPFKKDWYQLGVKRLLKYAADNDYDQVALVGPDEQIRRGSLGTHIDGLIYEKNADGTIKLMAEKGQSVVLDKTVEPKDLDLYVGKDVAKRILESKETDGTLTGDDLKIGGEGMRQYYGRNYPEYMNKLGKKYGTEAKKTQYTIKEFEPDDVEEVYTGEFDRYGREIMAFKVVDRETGEDIAFEYDFDKVLKEANKKAPATDMWLMDLPAKMKSDVKIGQPFKEGGAVTKDKDLMRWHKIQQLATGGAIKRLAESAKNKPWMKYAKSDKDKR
jgi:hypothetical protein